MPGWAARRRPDCASGCATVTSRCGGAWPLPESKCGDMPSPGADRARTTHLPRMLGLARPELRTIAWAIVFLVIGSAASLAFPQAIRILLDEGFGQGRRLEAL